MRNGLPVAIAHSYRYVLIAICLKIFSSPQLTSSETIVDYEKNDCSRSYTVNDADIFRLEAYPRLDVSSGRDRCFNQFVGSNGKKLKIYVSEVKVGSCGIFVQIYDGDEKMLNDPRWKLGCRGAERTVYDSASSDVIVRLDKPVADSTNLYSFRIYITNERGPAVDISGPVSMSDGGGASSGVIAGIGIGVGLVIVIIIIVVAIVCWRFMKMKEKQPYKSPAVFTTAGEEESVRFEKSLGGSRSYHHTSRATKATSSTSGSLRGRSAQPHENTGYVSSNDSSVTTKKVSVNPIPLKPGDGKKYEIEYETTHRFKTQDGSTKKDINSDLDEKRKTSRPNYNKERIKEEPESKEAKQKKNESNRSSSEKRSTLRGSTAASREDTSSDTVSSHSDRRQRQNDRYRDRSTDGRHRDRSRDGATRHQSQSQERRDRHESTRSRDTTTSRSARPSHRDEYDAKQDIRHHHRPEQAVRETRRHQDQYHSDYDSDNRSRRRENHDRNRGYDSDGRGHQSERGERRRSQRRHDQSDRNYSDYDSDHGRRRESSRSRRQPTNKSYRDYDSDDGYRSSRRQRDDARDKYYSEDDLVGSRRQRTGSLTGRSRTRTQSSSRDNKRR